MYFGFENIPISFHKVMSKRNLLNPKVMMEKDKSKSFNCEICDSHFKQRYNLKSHISSVHEEKKQARCEICGKSFQQKSNLIQHIARAHEGKKPSFKCEICDYSCSRKDQMKQHAVSIHERNQSHRRLHRVFILGTVRHRENVEQVLEHLLRVRLDISRGVPERGPGAWG